jgi:soluble P-type ATPase
LPECYNRDHGLRADSAFQLETPVIELSIPGRGVIQLHHLVCDVNGTLALDGRLIDGVAKYLQKLGDRLELHLLTADTHGKQDSIDQQLGLQAIRIPPGNEVQEKGEYVRQLGPDKVAAIGQGANDAEMLRLAVLGICLLSPEGLAKETLMASDLIAEDILSALALLESPLRLVASLRR